MFPKREAIKIISSLAVYRHRNQNCFHIFLGRWFGTVSTIGRLRPCGRLRNAVSLPVQGSHIGCMSYCFLFVFPKCMKYFLDLSSKKTSLHYIRVHARVFDSYSVCSCSVISPIPVGLSSFCSFSGSYTCTVSFFKKRKKKKMGNHRKRGMMTKSNGFI